jgi:hypothetical protein
MADQNSPTSSSTCMPFNVDDEASREEPNEQEHGAKKPTGLTRLMDASEYIVASPPPSSSSSSSPQTQEAIERNKVDATRPTAVTAATASPPSPRPTHIVCACTWGEQCRRFQQLFTQAGDPEFGGGGAGRLIPLPMSSRSSSSSSNSKKNQVWEQGLRASLGHDESDSSSSSLSSSSSGYWYVAPHHFDRRQIQWIRNKLSQQKSWADSDNARHMICRPMELAELARICNGVTTNIDKRFKIKQKSTKKSAKYFNLPNQTIQQVQEEVKRTVLPRFQAMAAAKQQKPQQPVQTTRSRNEPVPPPPPPTTLPIVSPPTSPNHLIKDAAPQPHAVREQKIYTRHVVVENDEPNESPPILPTMEREKEDAVVAVVHELSVNNLKEQPVSSQVPNTPTPDDVDDIDAVLMVPEYAWAFYHACRNGYRRRRWILALYNVQIITFTAASIILAVLYGHYYGSNNNNDTGFFPSLHNPGQLRTFIATIVLPLYVTIVMKSREGFLKKQPNLFPAAFTKTKAEIFKFRTRVGPYQTNEAAQCKEVLATRIQDIWKTVHEVLDDAKLALPDRFWEEHQQAQSDAKGATPPTSSKPMDEIDLEAQFDDPPTEKTPCLSRAGQKNPASVNKSVSRHDGEDDNDYLPLSFEEYMILRLQKRLDRKTSQVKFWQLEQNILNQSIMILTLSTSATAMLSLQWSIPILLALTTALSTMKKNGLFDNRIAVGTKVMQDLRNAQQKLGMRNTRAFMNADLEPSRHQGNTSWHQLVAEAEEIIVQGEIESFL